MKSKFLLNLILLTILFFFSCKKNEVVIMPVANFSPLIIEFGEVTFRNKSLNATEYLWDFGDGNTSTEKDPIHNYLEVGNYDVKLTASDGTNSDNFTLLIAIGQVFPPNLTRLDTPPFGERAEAFYFTHKDKGYMGGGIRFNPNFESPQDLWEFDPTSKEWTMISDELPNGFRSSIAFSVNDFAYFGLGIGFELGYDIYRTTLQNELFLTVSNVPLSFINDGHYTNAITFVHDEIPYLIGKGEFMDFNIKNIYKYDIPQQEWNIIGDYKCNGNAGMFHFLLGDKLYIGMGNRENNQVFNSSNDVWEYDVINNSWTQKNDFPGIGRRGGISFTYQGEGYWGFGIGYDISTGMTTFFSDLWKYNPDEDSWEKIADFPVEPKRRLYAFVLGDSLFFGGGYGSVTTTQGAFYEYKF